MLDIGSEFSYEEFREIPNNTFSLLESVSDYTFTFSGRTAIETVLKNEPHITTALLPSYCCDSMIEPFRKKGIKIYFYDVNFNQKFTINIKEENVDLILWCNYFGFKLPIPDFTKFIKKGGIVVEDITHSLFSKNKFNPQSNYLVASVRKWAPLLCGGFCGKVRGNLIFKPSKYPSTDYLDKKKMAMIKKNKFLKNKNSVSKADFLNEYKFCNEWLAENYSELSIDNESMEIFKNINYDETYEIRRNNAKILYSELKDCSLVHFLFDIEQMDCPIFVPIIIDDKLRDYVKNKLIKNNIFCPVHWAMPNDKCNSNIYNKELSLVCDQRYNELDMLRIADVIRNCSD